MRFISLGLCFLIVACGQSIISKDNLTTVTCNAATKAKGTIIQNYLLEYDGFGAKDSTYAEAVFRYSNPLGPSIELDAASGCAIVTDSLALILRNFNFTRYVARAVAATSSLKFTFTDGSLATHVNTVTLSTVAFNPAPTTMSLTTLATTTGVDVLFTPAFDRGTKDFPNYKDSYVLEITDAPSNPKIYLTMRPHFASPLSDEPESSTTFRFLEGKTPYFYSFKNTFPVASKAMCLRIVKEHREPLTSTTAGGVDSGARVSRYFTDYACVELTA